MVKKVDDNLRVLSVVPAYALYEDNVLLDRLFPFFLAFV